MPKNTEESKMPENTEINSKMKQIRRKRKNKNKRERRNHTDANGGVTVSSAGESLMTTNAVDFPLIYIYLYIERERE